MLVNGTLLKVDDDLQRAISNALKETAYIEAVKPRKAKRHALTETASVAAEEEGPNGYFSIVDATEEQEGGTVVIKIAVKDTSGLNRSQPCYVNGVVTYLPAWTSSALSNSTTYHVVVHYTAATAASGTIGTSGYVPASPATLNIETMTTAVPSDSATNVYWIIGDVVIDNSGKMTIQQDFQPGVIRMFWRTLCT